MNRLKKVNKTPGAQLVYFRGGWGAQFIHNRRDEIIHGLNPSVKCVAPLFRDKSSLWECSLVVLN